MATGTWSGLSVPGLDVPPPDVGREAAGAEPGGPIVSVTWDNLQIPGTDEGRLVQASAVTDGTPKVEEKRQSSAATGGTPRVKPRVNDRGGGGRPLERLEPLTGRWRGAVSSSDIHSCTVTDSAHETTHGTSKCGPYPEVRGPAWQITSRVGWRSVAWRRTPAADPQKSLYYVWLGGNDAYPRHWTIGDIDDEPSRRIRNTVETVRRRFDVYLVGPVPRPRINRNEVWEATPAFRLERRLADMARAAEEGELEGTGRVRMVAMGRRLCARKR